MVYIILVEMWRQKEKKGSAATVNDTTLFIVRSQCNTNESQNNFLFNFFLFVTHTYRFGESNSLWPFRRYRVANRTIVKMYLIFEFFSTFFWKIQIFVSFASHALTCIEHRALVRMNLDFSAAKQDFWEEWILISVAGNAKHLPKRLKMKNFWKSRFDFRAEISWTINYRLNAK